jgi:hypothetical protein
VLALPDWGLPCLRGGCGDGHLQQVVAGSPLVDSLCVEGFLMRIVILSAGCIFLLKFVAMPPGCVPLLACKCKKEDRTHASLRYFEVW